MNRTASLQESLSGGKTVGRWQRPDGWPTDAYFDAVTEAIHAAGITVADSWRDDDHDFTLQLGEAEAQQIGYVKLYISWRVGEDTDPLKDEWYCLQGGVGGWYWVPYSSEQKALGDFAKEFPVDVLAEPEQVAKAVADLIGRGDG